MATGGGGAFQVGSIYVDLSVRDSAYHSAMARAENAFNSLVNRFRSGQGGATALSLPLIAGARAAGMLRREMVALGAVAGAYLGMRGLFRETAKAEAQMNMLSRITGEAAGQVSSLGQAFNRMGMVMGGVQLDKVFDAAAFAAKLGVSNDRLQLFTHDMVKMGIVFNDIDTEYLTTRVARMLAVFHRGSDEAIRLASSLYKLDISSTANAREIIDVASRLSGTAAVLGMSPQKAMALATALKQANIPTETAGTSMTQILGRMASKRDMASFARMAGMGKAQWRQLLTTDPLEAVKAFTMAVRQMEPVSAIQSLDKLHLDGQRVRTTLLQLAQVVHLLDGYVQESESEWKSMNAIQRGAASMSELLSSKWTLLINNIQIAARALGTGLAPMFRGFLDGMTSLFRDLTGYFERNRGTIQQWAGVVGGLFQVLGTSVRNFSDMKGLLIAFWEQFTDPIAQVKDNIFLNVRAITGFMVATFRWNVKTLGQIGKNLLDDFKQLFFGLSNVVTSAMMRIKQEIHNAFVDLGDVFKALGPVGKGGIGAILGGILGPAAAPVIGALGMPAKRIPDADLIQIGMGGKVPDVAHPNRFAPRGLGWHIGVPPALPGLVNPMAGVFRPDGGALGELLMGQIRRQWWFAKIAARQLEAQADDARGAAEAQRDANAADALAGHARHKITAADRRRARMARIHARNAARRGNLAEIDAFHAAGGGPGGLPGLMARIPGGGALAGILGIGGGIGGGGGGGAMMGGGGGGMAEEGAEGETWAERVARRRARVRARNRAHVGGLLRREAIPHPIVQAAIEDADRDRAFDRRRAIQAGHVEHDALAKAGRERVRWALAAFDEDVAMPNLAARRRILARNIFRPWGAPEQQFRWRLQADPLGAMMGMPGRLGGLAAGLGGRMGGLDPQNMLVDLFVKERQKGNKEEAELIGNRVAQAINIILGPKLDGIAVLLKNPPKAKFGAP